MAVAHTVKITRIEYVTLKSLVPLIPIVDEARRLMVVYNDIRYGGLAKHEDMDKHADELEKLLRNLDMEIIRMQENLSGTEVE